MKSISAGDLARVVDYPEQIKDPRRTAYGNIRHKLADIIVIAFTAVLCMYEDYGEMEEFGRLRQDLLKGFLELPGGIPDESAFRRVLGSLNSLELQKGLYEDIREYFEGMESGAPEDVWQGGEEKGRGRIERREIRTAAGLEWLEGREAREDLIALVQYRTHWKQKGKETAQTDQYYISSGDFSAEEFLKYIRGHWSIENQLHWMLDIVFREDECRVRTGNAALNMNILRKPALHRLRKMKMEKKRVSAKRRMMHVALDSEFLYEALFSE
jgi:predicted transposase YbfD/YdcC